MCVCTRARGEVHAYVCVGGWLERGRVQPCLSSIQLVCATLWRHLWTLCLLRIFLQYLINGTIFEGKVLNIKCVFLFYIQLLSRTFIIVRRILRDIVKNAKKFWCKVPVILFGFSWNLNFLNRFSKKCQISNVIKIRPVGAELFHAEGRTDMSKLHVLATFRNSVTRA